MEGDDVGTHRLSRAELYDRVWTTPMRTLAAEFGISDVGLSKLCHRHEVPTPPRGYWVQKQHGKHASRPNLPSVGTAAWEPIVIQGSRRKPTEPTGSASPPFDVIVSERLVRPHPLAARTISALRAARPDSDGRVTSRGTTGLGVTVAPASIRRVGRILDALVKALEARGHRLEVNRLHRHLKMMVVVSKEEIGFALSEKLRQERREATPGDPLSYREYRLFPTGRLCLQIENHWLGTRTQWVDGTRQRLENCIGPFILQLEDLAAKIKKRRAEQEEAERLRRAWEKERADKLRLIEEEEERIKLLHEEANAWHRSKRLRAYIEAARAAAIANHGEVQPGSAHDRWLRWASEQADRIDPLKESPPCIVDQKREYASRY